ncbi:MAG: ABC transporter ATP-binding protein [Sphingobacteriaceae bacterium]|nr:ABC transporter ATP-binding protein [Sphingobacteriaceae bacterium]
MFCIETKNLTHRFSTLEVVLNNINLQVPEGSIYGFLGPNGAGKTTTLRLILGLLKKQTGDILVFGKPFQENRIEILKKVGSLIETPSLYGHLTAIENLKIFQKIYQCPISRIAEVLALVGLENTEKKKVSQFSLGMKQRLSIALSMLHNPSVLILDEPTNGLDPNGIIEIRELLKKLNRENRITILVSSHLLSEIEKLVTHVGIINKGNVIFQGTLDELLNKQKQSSHLVFDTNDAEKASKIFKDNDMVSETKNGKIIMPIVEREKIAILTEELVKNKIKIYEISSVKNDLESIFIEITNN